jgi:PKD repeat protein
LDIGTVDVTVNIGSAQLILSVTVMDLTDPSADAGLGGNLNEGDSFGFDASGSSDNGEITEYFWDFGDGETESSTSPTIAHIFANPGTYTVKLTVTDSGGNTDSDQVTITVWDVSAPTAQAVIPEEADEDIPCFFDASLSSDNVGIVEYEWNFGDGNSYKGEYKNVSHIYSLPGTYTVKLTVKDAAGYEASIASEVTVSDNTAPSTPKGVTVTPQVDGTSLKIEWDAVSDSDLKHYDIYVSENGGAFTKLQTIAKGTAAYSHTGLLMVNSYRYYLVSVDTSDNPSADSAVVEGRPDIDTDSDGVFDRSDEDDDGDGLSDFREVEEATDPKDPDSDDDRHEDGEDAFPLDKNEWKDSDFDGVGDSKDAFPKDGTEWKDSDGDGIGDKADFLPIHNLLFLIIMAIVIIAVIVGVMMMVKRRKQAAVSFDGEQTQAPEEPKTQPELQEEPEPIEEKELPEPPKKDLPPPPKKMQN